MFRMIENESFESQNNSFVRGFGSIVRVKFESLISPLISKKDLKNPSVAKIRATNQSLAYFLCHYKFASWSFEKIFRNSQKTKNKIKSFQSFSRGHIFPKNKNKKIFSILPPIPSSSVRTERWMVAGKFVYPLTSWKSDSAVCQGCGSSAGRWRKRRPADPRKGPDPDCGCCDCKDRQWQRLEWRSAASPTLSNPGTKRDQVAFPLKKSRCNDAFELLLT